MTWITLNEFTGLISEAGMERAQRRAAEGEAARVLAVETDGRALCSRCRMAPVWTPHAKLCRACRVECTEMRDHGRKRV